jgi:hypothetical protein
MSVAEHNYVISIQPLQYFRASEQVDHEKVQELVEQIQREGFWTTPLPVEMKSGLIMDGNHRLQAALKLGLRHLPCVELDYADSRVEVKHWQTGQTYAATHELADVVAKHGPLPFKTTRHRFDPPLPQTRIPLTMLETPLHDRSKHTPPR